MSETFEEWFLRFTDKELENYRIISNNMTYQWKASSQAAWNHQQKKIDALEKKLAEAVGALRFYGTYNPHQFPEGYYEICIEKGIGGHIRFGTLARKTLEEIEKGE